MIYALSLMQRHQEAPRHAPPRGAKDELIIWQGAPWATPLKLNMEPEKKSLEKEIPFGNHNFQVPC